MAIISNVSGTPVNINDIGIRLEIAATYDLQEESPQDVYLSEDLRSQITAGNIAVLDPLDDVTALSISEGIELVDQFGAANYRIFGGTLDQLDDVDTTGVVTDDVLAYDGAEWVPTNVDGLGFSRTVVNTATYNILTSDRFIGVQYTTTGAVTLTLPNSSGVPLGKLITIKDEGGNARRNAVTVNRAGSDTIEGGETSVIFKIDDFSVDLQWTGNEWSIV